MIQAFVVLMCARFAYADPASVANTPPAPYRLPWDQASAQSPAPNVNAPAPTMRYAPPATYAAPANVAEQPVAPMASNAVPLSHSIPQPSTAAYSPPPAPVGNLLPPGLAAPAYALPTAPAAAMPAPAPAVQYMAMAPNTPPYVASGQAATYAPVAPMADQAWHDQPNSPYVLNSPVAPTSHVEPTMSLVTPSPDDAPDYADSPGQTPGNLLMEDSAPSCKTCGNAGNCQSCMTCDDNWEHRLVGSGPCVRCDDSWLDEYTSVGPDWFRFDGLVRGYYLNDQRIEWSGLEATFGAEAILAPCIRRTWGEWTVGIDSEIYLNQRYDRNILIDSAERRSYAANWQPDIFEISNLLLYAEYGDFRFSAGKMESPFGRWYFPLYTNSRMDAPFIRSEAITWRETGFNMQYSPGIFVADIGLMNGSVDQDTNSSKALVSRLGLQGETWACGGSIKIQDGIGSEHQKIYDNYIGLDAMMRFGDFVFSGELIADEYGLRRNVIDGDDVFWGRSIYYRDQNKAPGDPITGVGYYVNMTYCQPKWDLTMNYGEYYPEKLGDPRHDAVNRRGIVKGQWRICPLLNWYSMALVENNVDNAQADRTRKGVAVLTGVSSTF